MMLFVLVKWVSGREYLAVPRQKISDLSSDDCHQKGP
jgi:hypothetical protein